jgi:endonuclease III
MVTSSIAMSGPDGARRSAAAGRRAALRASLEQTQLYSEELGIDLSSRADREIFKWFIASLLFGARISETIARRTYRALLRCGLLAPRKIVAAGWDFLVNPIMREGGYVRYDGRKSTQLIRDCEKLLHDYRGSLERLHEQATDAADLERRVTDFYGVGPVTANIFLRELRPYWAKADPEPLARVRDAARKLHMDLSAYDRKTLTFVRVETGLLRQRRALLGSAARGTRRGGSPGR